MNRIFSWAVPMALIGVGGLSAVGLFAAGQSAPARAEVSARVQQVQVVRVSTGEVPLTIHATGVVNPSEQIDLMPIVGGPVTWVAEDLRPGRRFAKGATIARIDDTSYVASVAEAETRVANARQALALENGRGSAATLEQALTGLQGAGVGQDLILRKPQRATAEAELKASLASLARAERDLRATHIRAPFDAVLTSESLDIGQVVNSNVAVGRLSGTTRALVELPVSVAGLDAIDLPPSGASSSSAIIHVVGQDPGAVRKGEVVGVTGQIDPVTRTASVLVSVDNPLDGDAGPILLPGTFVEVSIQGSPVPNATEVPEAALVDGSAVWVVDAENRLQRVPVDVAWRGTDRAIVRGDLLTGWVVTRPPAVPLAGTAVEPITENGAVALSTVMSQ